jgi:hypothetical protein
MWRMWSSNIRRMNPSKLRRRQLDWAVKFSSNIKKRERLTPQMSLGTETGRGLQLKGKSPLLLDHHHHQWKKSQVMCKNLIRRWIKEGIKIKALII